jgi:hypothetical protein
MTHEGRPEKALGKCQEMTQLTHRKPDKTFRHAIQVKLKPILRTGNPEK